MIVLFLRAFLVGISKEFLRVTDTNGTLIVHNTSVQGKYGKQILCNSQ